ncbi:MAG: 3-deoxy-D-manno-octulosonic acid kinase [Woeseiaceae bacterium]|nr:3-deoxy-D-manno-octulosonic acid kinase [Woeseiaceae bacterium]
MDFTGAYALTETVIRTDTGAILYDQANINQISDEQFTVGGWRHAEPVTGRLRSAGRGTTNFVGNVPRQFVLRHFVRGGLIGRIAHDRYLFTGEDGTRSFAEWRLLDKLASNGLRVPRPAAARYQRSGPFYRADIITICIPNVEPLSMHIADVDRDHDFWASVGAAIAEFHNLGVLHADMNAYNLQIDTDGDLWMLDFDKGRLAAPGAWKQQTLARLHRSLDKIKLMDPSVYFDDSDWNALLDGYFSESRSE